jgi:hypothetical protein
MLLELPNEILHAIYLLLCVDGGHAGCVLSQICRRIRETSALHRFHSVALPTVNHVQSFCAAIDSGGALAEADIVIRHLFVGGPVDPYTRIREAAAPRTIPRGQQMYSPEAIRASRKCYDVNRDIHVYSTILI